MSLYIMDERVNDTSHHAPTRHQLDHIHPAHLAHCLCLYEEVVEVVASLLHALAHLLHHVGIDCALKGSVR